jgi:hypothetical protein
MGYTFGLLGKREVGDAYGRKVLVNLTIDFANQAAPFGQILCKDRIGSGHG